MSKQTDKTPTIAWFEKLVIRYRNSGYSDAHLVTAIGGYSTGKAGNDQLREFVATDPDMPKFIAAIPKGTRAFDIMFWLAYFLQRNNSSSIRVKGHHFWANNTVPVEDVMKRGGLCVGHGGTTVRITRKGTAEQGETVIQTNNLWSQGDIPLYLQDLLPDNATLELPMQNLN